MGCFYIESPATRQLLRKMWGSDPATRTLLDNVLDETYGIAIYQEQVTQMAMALADFTAFEGDSLRKIITKKHRAEKLENCRVRFFEGGLKNKLAHGVLTRAWEQILSFSGYSFCKPHSASYALVSCKSAYLKTHYPAEFMAAVISNQGGFTEFLGRVPLDLHRDAMERIRAVPAVELGRWKRSTAWSPSMSGGSAFWTMLRRFLG